MEDKKIDTATKPEESAPKKEKLDIPEFPMNHKLLEEAMHIKEQWRVIRSRLDKIESSRSEVSPVVYERVKQDYQTRYEEITKILMDKKQDIDSELENLYATRSKIAQQLDEQRQSLEEVKFRNMLGEFSKEEYEKQGKENEGRINKFETAMQAVTTNINRYENIFHEEAELLGVEAAAPEAPEEIEEEEEEQIAVEEPSEISRPAIPKAEEAVEVEKPEALEEEEPVEVSLPRNEALETDEEGYIINETTGPDYFSKAESTDYDISNHSQTVRSTAVEGVEPERPPTALPRARVIIISGDLAGAAYPLKDTVSIGRADSNTIALKDAKVSRQHAQIQQHGNEYIVVDLNSSNGTYVNGEKIEEHVLQHNDEIQIGDYIMQFQA